MSGPSLSPVLPFYLVLILASTPAAGQEALVSPGERIRVKHACEGDVKAAPCDPVVGQVRSVSGDTVRLDGGRQLVLSQATKVELSGGRHGHALLGLGIGTAVGIGAGALSCSNSHSDMDGLCALAYLFTVPAGMLGGLIIGALTKSEKWETVRRPAARLEVVPAVAPNAVGVVGRVSF